MREFDFIVLSGAPGVGKSAIGWWLSRAFGSPHLEVDWLLQMHPETDWRLPSPAERKLAFENLVLILQNYIAHGYTRVIVSHVEHRDLEELARTFHPSRWVNVRVVVENEDELRHRVTKNDRGFQDVERALESNRRYRSAPLLPNEVVFENDQPGPEGLVERLVKLLPRDA